MSTKHTLHVSHNQEEYRQQVQAFLTNVLDLTAPQRVIVGVSGGSMPKVLCPILQKYNQQEINRLRLFPVDERLVPADDTENNVGAYLQLLPEAFHNNFIRVQNHEDAQLAAFNFIETLKKDGIAVSKAGCPIFDVLFLGLGPDGHTCSLFPGHPLLQETEKWIAPIEDSPKPPTRRVTVTMPVLNLATHVAFLVTGQSKAQVVKEIVSDHNPRYPPSLIQRQQIHWFLDEPASSKLNF